MGDDAESARHKVEVGPEHLAYAAALGTPDAVIRERDKLIREIVDAHPDFVNDEVGMSGLLGNDGFIIVSVPAELGDVAGRVAQIQALNSRAVELDLEADRTGRRAHEEGN